jgi:Undecaprenyl-phosphate galactose phosphotransferase WbaP
VHRRALSALHGLVLGLADAAALPLALVAAFALAGSASEQILGVAYVDWSKALRDRLPVLVPILVGLAAWLHGRGRYDGRQPFWSETRDLVSGCLLALFVEGFTQYAVKEQVSRLWISGSWLVLPVVATGLRVWMKACLSVVGVRDLPVVVLGPDGERESVVAALRAERSIGWEVSLSAPFPTEGAIDALVAGAAHVVVVGQPAGRPLAVTREIARLGIPFSLCLPVAGSGLASMRPVAIVGQDFILMGERPGLSAPAAKAAKRLSDMVLALALACATLPVALATAVVIAFDGGRVLYAQERIGRGGRTFRCLKFRTMVPDAEARLARLLAEDPEARAEWERDRKLRNDPRITRIGRFLRGTAIDELPQLLNVLRGEMSFVGPRPVTRSELPLYGDEVSAYLDVRPGLTGLWQASGRNDLSYARRVALDAWYVRNWSAWLDLVVLLKTMPAVLARRGAY